MELKGSKTEANLMAAFAGESQARNKYTYFASKARKEGYVQIAEIFEETANKTNGVLTYYYRIDPAVSRNVKGFWYTNLEGNEFTEHEVTDISQ